MGLTLGRHTLEYDLRIRLVKGQGSKISDQNFLLQYISIDFEKIEIRIHQQLELNSFLTLENCG